MEEENYDIYDSPSISHTFPEFSSVHYQEKSLLNKIMTWWVIQCPKPQLRNVVMTIV